jgi:hypothetical protein
MHVIPNLSKWYIHIDDTKPLGYALYVICIGKCSIKYEEGRENHLKFIDCFTDVPFKLLHML